MGAKGKVAVGLFSAVLFLSAGSASAGQGGNGQGENNNNQGQNGTHAVPELSAGALPLVAAILLGGTALLATRRVKSQQ